MYDTDTSVGEVWQSKFCYEHLLSRRFSERKERNSAHQRNIHDTMAYILKVDTSRKHAYIMLTPLNPTFYIVKLGFTGVYIIFLISAQNIDCGYSLEPPRQGGSKEYPQSMFCVEI